MFQKISVAKIVHPSNKSVSTVGAPISLRLPGLDGLRAFCILLVFLGHSSWTHGYPGAWRAFLEALPESPAVFGVQIFFVISGFLITCILTRNKALTSARLKTFYGRRALRILPPAYAYLLFLAVWGHFTEFNLGKIDLIASVFFFRHMAGINDCLHHFWSLSIEEQFYLLFPWILLLARNYRLHVTVGLLLAQPVLRVAAASCCAESTVAVVDRAIRFDAIMTGCLLSLIYRNQFLEWLGVRHGTALLVFSTGLIMATFTWNYHFETSLLSREIITVLRNVSIAGIIVGLVNNASPLCRPFNIRWVAWIGSISYSLYLWQQFIFWPTPRSLWFHWFPMNVVVAFLVGVVAHYVIERPCDSLRDRLSYRR